MNDIDFQLFETSAKENLNVEEMFRAVTKLVLRSKRDQESVESINISLLYDKFYVTSLMRNPNNHNRTPYLQLDRRGGEGGGGRDGHGDRIHLNRTRPQRKEKGKSNCCK